MPIFRLLAWAALIYIGYRIISGFIKGKQKEQVAETPTAKGEETQRDPVCGTYVTEADAIIGRNGDERLFFCSMACLEKHKAELEQRAAAQLKN